MTDFNGWNMPLYYKGCTEEHLHTRSKAGLFDLCHMGRVFVTGTRAHEFVDFLTPARVKQAQVGDVLYSFLLNQQGAPIDDITIYFLPEKLMLVINAGNRERDVEWIKEQAASFTGVEVEDASDRLGMIALQGPLSDEIVKKLGMIELPEMAYYRCLEKQYPDLGTVIVSSTGYTGEKGYEFYLDASTTATLWQKLISADDRVMPIGLGARDSLRLEAAMPLYGHELTTERSPAAAGLSKFVDFEKPYFIGKTAVVAEKQSGGPGEKLVGFEVLQRGPIARQGHTVLDISGNTIGTVASGIFSPTLQKTIGTAYIIADQAKLGESIQIEIRGRKMPANIVKRPFYKRSAS